MDGADVERAVIFGMPLIKKWNAFNPIKPHYYLDGNVRCYYSYTDPMASGTSSGCSRRPTAGDVDRNEIVDRLLDSCSNLHVVAS